MANRIERKTHKIDASGKSLGRLASEAAIFLIGKNKPEFESHIDAGDFVHIINVEKVKFTGNKVDARIYYSHSQYPGGLRELPLKKLVEEGRFEEIFKRTVNKMLPKNKSRVTRLKRITFGKAK
jgi:large subunit ribosomal protein L13